MWIVYEFYRNFQKQLKQCGCQCKCPPCKENRGPDLEELRDIREKLGGWIAAYEAAGAPPEGARGNQPNADAAHEVAGPSPGGADGNQPNETRTPQTARRDE